MTGPQSPKLTSLNDLAGKDVFVRKSSSYWEHLEQLNARFKKEGKAAIVLRPAPEDLEDEDLLEMLNAGLFGIAVVDDYKLEIWAKIYPKIKARPDLAVSSGGELAWAFRPNSPQLKTALDAFLKTHRQGTTFGNTLIKRYLGSTQVRAERAIAGRDQEVSERRRPVQEVRRQVRRRLPADAGAGLSGVAPRPEGEEPGGRRGRDAGHASDRQGAGRRRHLAARAEHPRRREVHAIHDRSLLRERTR